MVNLELLGIQFAGLTTKKAFLSPYLIYKLLLN